jgi:hypothetical protein
MSVIDDARQVADEFPTGEGFVVALANPMNVHQSCAQGMAKYRVLFLKKVDHTPPRPYIEGGVLANVIGGSLENAHIYPTWEAAAAGSSCWRTPPSLCSMLWRSYELFKNKPEAARYR